MKDYFSNDETRCLCGCGENNVSKPFRYKLNKTRTMAAIPFIPTSFCRCKIHNKKEGGKEDSAHLSDTENEIECEAVDIKAVDSRTRFKIIQAAIIVDINRIGIAKTFIHLDDDKTKPPEVAWLY